MGAGHTHHRKGPYQETVRRGLYYLRAVAAETQPVTTGSREACMGMGSH